MSARVSGRCPQAPALFSFATLQVTGARLAVTDGANKVRPPAPLRVGCRVRLAFESPGINPVEGGTQVTYEALVEVEGSNEPAMAAELLYRYDIT